MIVYVSRCDMVTDNKSKITFFFRYKNTQTEIMEAIRDFQQAKMGYL